VSVLRNSVQGSNSECLCLIEPARSLFAHPRNRTNYSCIETSSEVLTAQVSAALGATGQLYRSQTQARSVGLPEKPRFAMSCLSFCWFNLRGFAVRAKRKHTSDMSQ